MEQQVTVGMPLAAVRPEFGQIRSEAAASGQFGPSVRADRQYKPF